ncbi:MAG: hypothetical protein ACR2PZ_09955, partial [Pseudomonadales bacterium]
PKLEVSRCHQPKLLNVPSPAVVRGRLPTDAHAQEARARAAKDGEQRSVGSRPRTTASFC